MPLPPLFAHIIQYEYYFCGEKRCYSPDLLWFAPKWCDVMWCIPYIVYSLWFCVMCFWYRQKSYTYIPFRVFRLRTCFLHFSLFFFDVGDVAFFVYDLYRSGVVNGNIAVILRVFGNYWNISLLICFMPVKVLLMMTRGERERERRSKEGKTKNHWLLTRFLMELHPFPWLSILHSFYRFVDDVDCALDFATAVARANQHNLACASVFSSLISLHSSINRRVKGA